jgi:hypothetical protein
MFEKAASLSIGGEQTIDLRFQLGVSRAGFADENVALIGWQIESGLEDLRDGLPAREGHSEAAHACYRIQQWYDWVPANNTAASCGAV